MKQIWKKLKHKSGETLVETMAAILIFTFGSIMMLNMVTSAAEINKMVEKADQQYLKDMQAVEKADTKKSGNYHVVFATSEGGLIGSAEKIPVEVYGSETGTLYAYYQKGGSVS